MARHTLFEEGEKVRSGGREGRTMLGGFEEVGRGDVVGGEGGRD